VLQSKGGAFMQKNFPDTRTVAVGKQDFEDMISHNNFYIDKTRFIKEWWENEDSVTLITRPRRFGKTLLLSMTETFFSIEYKEKSYLFEGMDIFKEEGYRALQGSYPVIFLSFASIKETTYLDFYEKVQRLIAELYRKYSFLMESDQVDDFDKKQYMEIRAGKASKTELSDSLLWLSRQLYDFYGKKPIILLDEYDTPMQEAYLSGYWDEMVSFMRTLFNAALKTNPYLERALLTGITRVSKESIFSDLNNLTVVTTTSVLYEDSFGFTEQEVFQALDNRGMGDYKEEVKQWYDGFTFGNVRDIYNPWSIINFLKFKKFALYWANTSSNGLISHLLRSAGIDIKQKLEILLKGGNVTEFLDEQIVFSQLNKKKGAIWSLLLACGYLKIENADLKERTYILSLTNYETACMMKEMVSDWFGEAEYYNEFLKALLSCDLKAMNVYMNRMSMQIFSFFDTGKHPSGTSEPERFYHGFVLGLIAELGGKYDIRSNRESGFGRYDVMMEPKNREENAYIFEFKVHDSDEETTLSDTAAAALKQIEEKNYEQELLAKGMEKSKIKKYAFAFEGKQVLIKESENRRYAEWKKVLITE
jgi:hypothetical protein